jgi:transcriptional regulator with XRE-family HTH domain
MDLRHIFIANLKKTRKKEGFSQMVLAERCGTSTSYIGEIEIGKKFPSLEMVERIAAALKIAPYRLFMDESGGETQTETTVFLERTPDRVKDDLLNQMLAAISADIEKILKDPKPVLKL